MGVLSFERALGVVLEHAGIARTHAQTTETVALEEAAGRVLAEDVMADRDQPPFHRSTRDGYAVRAADGGEPLRVVGTLRAGEVWSGKSLEAGEAIEIMTGAPLPQGADAVVMVEHVALADGNVRLAQERIANLRVGQNIVPRGAEARTGDAVLLAGTLIGAAEVAVAASCGRGTLPVFRKPRVTIVATGDELVELDAAIGASQIRNSNSYALAAMVQAKGGDAERLTIAHDAREDLRERIGRGRESDLLVLSGGVSMGKYDLVEEVLAEFGAEFLFTGVMIQPGRPVVFGRLPKRDGSTEEWTYFFGLPGNPVSTQVTFALFVAPLLRAMAGCRDVAQQFVEARLGADVKGGSKVIRFLPAELQSAWNAVTVSVVGWHGSGDVAANARGNCYVVLPAGVDRFSAGDTVRVLLR